jgi:hypothetical protein
MNTVTLYHGTSRAKLESILRDGLRTSHHGEGGDHWARERGWNVADRKRPPSVFVARKRETAEEFASIASEETGTDPIVLTLKVPAEDFYRDFKNDGGYSSRERGNALRTERDIPPEWIASHEVTKKLSDPFGDKTLQAFAALLAAAFERREARR